MISGTRIDVLATAVALLVICGTTMAETGEQVAAIIGKIETPRDRPIEFVERRANRLLTEPLILNGHIIFTSDGTLVKEIGEPFAERIMISARQVELQRAGKVRRLSLDRRPDIKAFYVGMQALLAGDATALFESFEVVASEDEDEWRLDLTPKERKLSRFVARFVISGTAERVRTVRTEQPGGDWQEMSFYGVAD
jgi:hypothetical protein